LEQIWKLLPATRMFRRTVWDSGRQWCPRLFYWKLQRGCEEYRDLVVLLHDRWRSRRLLGKYEREHGLWQLGSHLQMLEHGGNNLMCRRQLIPRRHSLHGCLLLPRHLSPDLYMPRGLQSLGYHLYRVSSSILPMCGRIHPFWNQLLALGSPLLHMLLWRVLERVDLHADPVCYNVLCMSKRWEPLRHELHCGRRLVRDWPLSPTTLRAAGRLYRAFLRTLKRRRVVE
jgi:hypothetical protein